MKIDVRESKFSDAVEIESVCDSAVATLRKTYRPKQKAIAHKQAISPTLTRLVALVNGRVVGTVQYTLTSGRVHFLSLDVHADWRRQGVARRLVTELEAIGIRSGAKRLSTYTVTQTGNCEIFQRLGFHVVAEEVTDYYESDQHDTLTESYLEREI